MNREINPVLAIFIVVSFIALIVFKYWANGQAILIGGPNQLQHDRAGNFYIGVMDSIYKLSPQMRLITEYQLKDLEITDLVGDFAFFANGDILIRKGRYEPSLLERLLIFARLSDLKKPNKAKQNEGLVRCQLESLQCRPFSSQLPDFTSAHHIDIDWRTDEVYISDTGQHTLYKLDVDGNILATRKSDLRFPNSIVFMDHMLYVADTNHNSIKALNPDGENFAALIQRHSIVHRDYRQHRWVFSFVRAGGLWWVNNMNHNMRNGKVLVYDLNWEYVAYLPLDQTADPIDIKEHAGYIHITDLDNIDIYSYDYHMKKVSLNWPQPIRQKLARLKQEKAYYQNLDSYGSYAFVLLFIIGIAFGIWQQIKSSKKR